MNGLEFNRFPSNSSSNFEYVSPLLILAIVFTFQKYLYDLKSIGVIIRGVVKMIVTNPTPLEEYFPHFSIPEHTFNNVLFLNTKFNSELYIHSSFCIHFTVYKNG